MEHIIEKVLMVLAVIMGIALIALIYIVIMAANVDQIKDGIITDMQFTKKHTDVISVPHTMKVGNITTFYSTPTFYHYDDDYAISIEQKSDMTGEDAQTAVWHVNKKTFETYKVGDRFIYDEKFCSEKAKYTEEDAPQDAE